MIKFWKREVSMMKKLFLSLAILLGSLVVFSTISEAASVSPPSQEIRGSTAKASWGFSWSNDGANAVRFNPMDGSGTRVWDSNNTVGYSPISYNYYSQSSWVTYKPSFMAVRISDGTAKTATATVHKRLP